MAALALVAMVAAPGVARADETAAVCRVPLDIVRLANPLNRVALRLAHGEPITIVAVGSSSTSGAGASSPAASYPSRLQAELSQFFPRQPITVLNRGVNGEEINDMLRRFDTAVIEAKPDLVLWQLGTNSVIRDHPTEGHDSVIRDGIARIKATGADIVLIDPQFAPKVIAKPEAELMVELIAFTAKQENVALFRRYEFMRRWKTVDRLPFETFVSPDGLHLNDWSYGCLAKGLAAAIVEAATRPVTTSQIRR